MTKLKALLRDTRGASMVEYSILIGIITAATIAAIIGVSGKVKNAWETLNGFSWGG